MRLQLCLHARLEHICRLLRSLTLCLANGTARARESLLGVNLRIWLQLGVDVLVARTHCIGLRDSSRFELNWRRRSAHGVLGLEIFVIGSFVAWLARRAEVGRIRRAESSMLDNAAHLGQSADSHVFRLGRCIGRGRRSPRHETLPLDGQAGRLSFDDTRHRRCAFASRRPALGARGHLTPALLRRRLI